MLSAENVERLAAELWEAESSGKPVASLRHRSPRPSPEDAYNIQSAVTAIRLGAGERIVGRKVGLTSKAMQEMSGVTEPDYGNLFDTMQVESGSALSRASLIQPMIEPELAFVMGEGLEGPAVTHSDVLRACEYVTPVLEVVDSRITDWDIDWVDTVSDNASAGRFVVGGDRTSPRDRDVRAVEVVLKRNEETVATAAMTEVLGDPVAAVVWLVNRLASHGAAVEAGDVLLAGAPCRAIRIDAGDTVEAFMTDMEPVTVRVV